MKGESFLKKRNSILIASTIALLILGIWLFWGREKLSSSDFDENVSVQFENATLEISKVWRQGIWNEEMASHCPYLIKTSKVCRPEYLQCWLASKKGRLGNVLVERHKSGDYFSVQHSYKVKNQYFPIKPLKLTLVNGAYSSSFLLQSNCDDSYLPQRKYAAGVQKTYRHEWTWDNFNQHIYIDRFPVTFWDLHFFSDLKIPYPKDKKDWRLPASGLTSAQMENYCLKIGKEILQSQVFDAASFLPMDLNNASPSRVVRAPYPWSRRKTDGHLYKAKKGELSLTTENCRRVYTKECLKLFPFGDYEKYAPTWMGIFQSLGGYFEYVKNPREPKQNLKASSLYFDAKSEAQQLGYRLYWDGEDFLYRNFNWKYDSPDTAEETFKVTFRCMKRVYQ